MKKNTVKKTTNRPRVAAGTGPAPKPALSIAVSRRDIASDLIAARAYLIWEQQGCPPGNDVANWLLAEQQLQREKHGFSA